MAIPTAKSGSRPALRAALLLACCLFTRPAWADSYGEGLAAYEAGDPTAAAGIWRPLAEAGDLRAGYGLGLLYEQGAGGLPRDPAQAAGWYERTAAAGLLEAQNSLGQLYAEGRGVPRDMARAAGLWAEAAARGHPRAQYNLALTLYRGEGVTRDRAAALDWFRRAAQKGVPEAQFAAGEMYRLGIGVAEDQGTALSWYQRARARGHQGASAQADLLTGGGAEAKPLVFLPPLPSERPAETALPRPETVTAEATVATPQSDSDADPDAGTVEAAIPPLPLPRKQVASPSAAVAPPVTVASDVPAAEGATVAESVGAESVGAESVGAESVGAEDPVPADRRSFAVWLGSDRSDQGAQALRDSLRTRFAVLAEVPWAVRPARMGDILFYRVVAGDWPERAAAEAACGLVRASETPAPFCLVLAP